VGSWFVDKVLPGLIDAVPFVLIVGFGMRFHLRGIRKHVEQANEKQTEQIEAKTDQQTRQIVQKLGGRR
jgi:hypothetical protein